MVHYNNLFWGEATMKAYQANSGINTELPITIEVSATASAYLRIPMTDDLLLGTLRQLEPSIVKAVWLDTNIVDELGLYRVGYLSDLGVRHTPPSERFQWHENKVWVVPAEEEH